MAQQTIQKQQYSKGQILLSLINKTKSHNPQILNSIQYKQTHQYLSAAYDGEVFSHCNPTDQRRDLSRDGAAVDESNVVFEIYAALFGEEELKLRLQDFQNERDLDFPQHLKQDIVQEVVRLQQVQDDHIQILKIFDRGNTRSTQDKWKLVVLSYKDKNKKLQTRLSEQMRMRKLFEDTIEANKQEIARLQHINNIKFKKIDTMATELEIKDGELSELNRTVLELQGNLSKINEEYSRLQQDVSAIQREKMEISLVMEREREKVVSLEAINEKTLAILSEEEYSVNKQIADLKFKYETEITTLEAAINHLEIQKHELLLEQLQVKVQRTDAYVQTHQNVVKACYFNSLADDMEGDEEGEEGEDQYMEEGEYSRHLAEERADFDEDCDFNLSIDPRSSNLHKLDTDRQKQLEDHLSDNESEKGQNNAESINIMEQSLPQISFDECRSISNASRYMQTVEQLTSQLAQAYQKINQLSTRVQQLELSSKPKPVVQNVKAVGSYFTSFFKK